MYESITSVTSSYGHTPDILASSGHASMTSTSSLELRPSHNRMSKIMSKLQILSPISDKSQVDHRIDVKKECQADQHTFWLNSSEFTVC